ncbi:DUF3794 domain-containing protein [Serpentinicella sp. ANB-PHB4]|uniref:DUF3794 and LysM peptidoglycan-binding domain-containing protein n=1 Tax=Serpentinicella sp. ANB-PHB4 TaxID=3074076 RepID=UPI002862FDCC|nr:SPOCS domain-containing protein [Serpentinicella sp. ANB-PHB4]MDR5659136.1 DUF3794 domain-containing protein [Serpentinicella sp. ANB-PHB4]
MPIELVKDLFKVEQPVGENMAQAIVEGDIIVPDAKPDITRILTVDGMIHIKKKEVKENSLDVEGVIHFKILYASDSGDEPLYNIDSITEFNQKIEIPGLNSEMDCEVISDIEHIDYTINNDRKIGVKAVINLDGKGLYQQDVEITKDVENLEDIELLKETIQYTSLIGSNTSETLVKDAFELEDEMPGIKEVLNWNGKVFSRETKVTDGKVIVGGTLYLDLLYIADDEEDTLNVMKKEIPFTHFVEVTNAYSDMQCKVEMNIEELNTEVKENIQGVKKIVEVESVVKLKAKVMELQEKEVLVDAYSPTQPLKAEKNEIVYNQALGMSKSNITVKETLQIPAEKPPINKVLSVQTKSILTDYTVSSGKVVVEGVLEAIMLYTAEDNYQPIYSYVQEIPFKQSVDISNLTEDAKVNLDLFTQEVEFSQINGQQVDVKANVLVNCDAYCNKKVEVIVSAEEAEVEESSAERSSLTICFFQKGDSLWQLAKKYNTTVKQIMETNNIESPDAINPGDHIIIEKVYNFKF